MEATEAQSFQANELQDRVVSWLLFAGSIQMEQVEAAWNRREQMRTKGSDTTLWRVLAQDPMVDGDTVYAAAAHVYAYDEVQEAKDDVLTFLKDRKEAFSEEQWERLIERRLLPITQTKKPGGKQSRLVFATYDPSHPDVLRLLEELGIERYELRFASQSLLVELISEAFPKKNEYLERIDQGSMAFDMGASFEDEGELIDEDQLEAEISRSALINLFEATLVEAVREGASDIHIYPNARKEIEIHFRLDGELQEWHVEKRIHPEAFLAVAKDNAVNVDRFERDTAQDGFIQRWIDEALIRFRVSILPLASSTQEVRAESVVIRVLDDRKVISDLQALGLDPLALERFEVAIRQPYGMMVLTGPTGSGKTTTLYASLQQVVSPKVNVLTVEDPVEYIVPGVRQIKLSHKLELEGALRAILRHDPDVVMVGEMRDRQTAELAIKLANTGHLTFSTLHTNDAPSAVSRLYKMGIEPFLIAYSINLIVAQRLIRKLCPQCKRVEQPNDDLLLRLGFSPDELEATTFYAATEGGTCPTCKGVGYVGRRAITETMPFSEEIRRLIVVAHEMVDEDAIRKQALQEGMRTLQMSAREVVKQGETSIKEMMRVVFTQ